MGELTRLKVAVADRGQTRQVAERLRQQTGMVVEQILESVGGITGLVDAEKLEEVRRVDGVKGASVVQAVHIAPPDSKIQ